jgi:hypothetical protein
MEQHPVIKKLQWKPNNVPVLILGAPKEYEEVMAHFEVEVHTEINGDAYGFIHVFGASNEDIRNRAKEAVAVAKEDCLLWLSYPKKSSKKYKGSDCSRESVAGLISEEGFEPVRQVAIDDDWSALRFRHVSQIKTMTRKFAVTKEGIERTSREGSYENS